jgi:hypothetical protein
MGTVAAVGIRNGHQMGTAARDIVVNTENKNPAYAGLWQWAVLGSNQ